VTLDLISSRSLSVGSLGWEQFDLTPIVQKWYGRVSRHRIRHGKSHRGRGASKLTLLLDCSGCLNSVVPLTFPQPPAGEETETELPFLVLETESVGGGRRSRRRALECGAGVKECCKERFFISFAELGWDDWIIAPRGYYANYCRGECGGAHRTPDTFLSYHTHVMEEWRRTEAGRLELSRLRPCCAPTRFSPISLIYFGPDLNIIKRDLPKMIVEECGCP
jgi:inhibin beta